MATITFFIVDIFTSKYSLHILNKISVTLWKRSEIEVILYSTLAFALLVVVGFPCSLVMLFCGYIFSYKMGFTIGVTLAVIFSSIAIVIGSSIIYFMIFIFFQQDVLNHIIHNDMRFLLGVEKALLHKGLWINFLLRIAPVVPYGLLNIAMPALGCVYQDFLLGLLTGNLPHAIFFAFIGASLSDIDSILSFLNNGPLVVTIISVVVSCILIIMTTYLILEYTTKEIANYQSDSDPRSNQYSSLDRRNNRTDDILQYGRGEDLGLIFPPEENTLLGSSGVHTSVRRYVV